MATFLHSKERMRDFPGGPEAKTLRSQHRGAPRLDPWSGNKIPHATKESAVHSEDGTSRKRQLKLAQSNK